jgi:hypothetical protein
MGINAWLEIELPEKDSDDEKAVVGAVHDQHRQG